MYGGSMTGDCIFQVNDQIPPAIVSYEDMGTESECKLKCTTNALCLSFSYGNDICILYGTSKVKG